ncbi:MAG TPA: lysozyme [Cyclobacteriaceae bacterium]|nr:lysozyme [Cyclobacteriaceae bacterium]
MKTTCILLISLSVILFFSSRAKAQMTYKDLSSHFVSTWEAKTTEWTSTRNTQYIIYILSAALTAVSGALHAMKKGSVAVVICLTSLIGLSTQVSWLFNIQPKKYDRAAKIVGHKLDKFKRSLYGLDLNQNTEFLISQQQKLENELNDIEEWLMDEQTESSSSKETYWMNDEEAPVFLASFQEYNTGQCIEPQYDFSQSRSIKAGAHVIPLPDPTYGQMKGDENSVYLVGAYVADGINSASFGADECIKSALSSFIQANVSYYDDPRDTPNSPPKTFSPDTSPDQVASGLLGLSDEFFIKFNQQSNQTACLKITRISKRSFESYFSSVYSLRVKNIEQLNKDFQGKLAKTKYIKGAFVMAQGPEITLIKTYEGFSRTAVNVPGYRSAKVIGFGHYLTSSEQKTKSILIGGQVVEYNDGITEDQAAELLNQDLTTLRRAVDEMIKVKLTTGQKAALYSLTQNMGVRAVRESALLKKVNAKKFAEIPHEFEMWSFENGKKQPNLVRRRNAEIKVWKGVE